jgi:hypothetical protein
MPPSGPSSAAAPGTGLNSQRHDPGPLLARGRLVTVDGHPICASCGLAVLPLDAGGWGHLPEGAPVPGRSHWFARLDWRELRDIRDYRDFTRRYPWTVRPELCGGAVTTEEDWAEGMRRLRDYHARFPAARRRRRLHPGQNPYLDLAQVLAGGRRLAWAALPAGVRNVLDLPSRRKELAAVFAWAIPDDPALALLARYSPLLECGAGTGYWAALLAGHGVNVLASDVSPPGSAVPDGRTSLSQGARADGANAFHGTHRPWAEVAPLDAVSAVTAHPGRVLFLCWPPFDDDSASYAPLRAYRGEVLLYAGDVPGPDGLRGATGTTRFHRELALNWTPAEEAALPNWPGLADRLVVYRRNAARRSLAQRDRCPGCGRYLPTGAIGRCDRCFTLRPPAMALQVNGHRVEYPAQVVAAMPEGLRRAFERSPSLLWPKAGSLWNRPGEHESGVVVDADGCPRFHRLVAVHDAPAVGQVAAPRVDPLRGSVTRIQAYLEADHPAAG